MLVCRLDWEGLAEDTPRTKDALVETGATLAGRVDSNSTLRIRYSCSFGVQQQFMSFALGDEKWPSEAARRRPKFGDLQYDTGTPCIGFGAGCTGWLRPLMPRISSAWTGQTSQRLEFFWSGGAGTTTCGAGRTGN